MTLKTGIEQILREVREKLERYESIDIAELESLCREIGIRGHIAVMTQPYLDYIVEGTKQIESRFTKNRVLPFRKVESNDVIFLKKNGGPIIASIVVSSVDYFGPLESGAAEEIIKNNSQALRVQDSFVEQKRDSKFGTLIHIRDVCLLNPITLEKSDRRPWVVLSTLDSEDSQTYQTVLQ